MAQAAWSIGEKPLDRLEKVEIDPSWTKCRILAFSVSGVLQKLFVLTAALRFASRLRGSFDGRLWG